MTPKEINFSIDKALAFRGEHQYRITIPTSRGEFELIFRAAPHSNPGIKKIVYEVSAGENKYGVRNFDAKINRTYDTRKQYVMAIYRRHKFF